jgi:hypothetical protein
VLPDANAPRLGAAGDSFTAASVLDWTINWDNFRDEYPNLSGDVTAWQLRLALALARSFEE